MSVFRGAASATQSLSAGSDQVLVFGNEITDPDGGLASNIFTVPSGWADKLGYISGGIRLSSAVTDFQLKIQRSVDGGTIWTDFRIQEIRSSTGSRCEATTVRSGPILFTAGDKYRLVYNGPAVTKSNNPNNFFGGYYIDSTMSFSFFHVEKNAVQVNNGFQFTSMTWETEIDDPLGAFASNTFTVPALFNGGWIDIMIGMESTHGAGGIYCQRSTGGGYGGIGQHITDAPTKATCQSGPYPVSTGHTFQAWVYNSVAFSANIQNTPLTFFSGLIWKP